ncbi:helix-turn-helix transcriptional regulator [Halodesulfovibrio aestuarii]
MGCLQNWIPASSTSHPLGSCILTDIKLIVHTLAPSSKPKTFAFKTADAPVEFMYCISGGVQIFATANNGKTIYTQLHEGTGAVLHLPLCNGYSIAKPNSPLQLVELQIAPENLQRLTTATGCPLQSKLKHIFEGDNAPSVLQDTPLPLPIRLTLKQILECPPNKEMSDLFLEYKKMELIYQQVTQLNSNLLKNKCNKRHHMHRAYLARKILMEDMVTPPSLLDLAVRVGMNKTQLNKTFRDVFGDTVFGVLRSERLKCARKMLEDGASSVTDVAYECGFSSPSHLTKAFTEEFGVRPKQYQTAVLNQQLGTPI